MSSAFFESIGLGFIDIGYILIGMTAAILILLILLIVQISKTNKKYSGTKKTLIFLLYLI